LAAESAAVVKAVEKALNGGFRTKDIATAATPVNKILSTKSMGDRVVAHVASKATVEN
jgi:3-isopropylmalate dehydrogenase